MTQTVAPSKVEIIPATAPFSPEQRAWLNGYLAAVFSNEQTVTMLSAEDSAALMTGVVAAASERDDDDAPWHDQTLTLGDRMALAEGRPLRRRMMAAMAQQDCGQCGYDCAKYAEAIASRSEERLNLCVPGSKETARMLKQLYAELGAADAKLSSNAIDTKLVAPQTPVLGRSRDHPTAARLASRRRLNASGSEKETWHVEFDLAHSGLEYSVGDSFGVYPTNDPDLVEAVVRALQAAPDFPIGHRMLRDVLIADVSLGAAPDRLFQLFSYITGGDRRQKAKLLASGEDPDGDASTLDVLDAIGKFKGVRPDPEAFIEALDPLQPRLYSIASSIKMKPNTIALCVDAVRYRNGSRNRFGVASTFLAERIKPGERAKVYVQKAHNFGLPSDPTIPIIMIGPGTGIAPFRAFLQERAAIGAPGPNWLFFGHQRSGLDFFYKDELHDMKAKGSLARLSLAWSRDGDQKFYVQDRMREVGRDLWAWIADGAHIYVCGDAKRMAKDVERALVDIAAQFGVRSTDEAIAFVANLKKNGRYQQDVY